MMWSGIAITCVLAFIGGMMNGEGDNLVTKFCGAAITALAGFVLCMSLIMGGALVFQNPPFNPDRCQAYAWQEVEKRWKCFDGSEP